MTSRLKIWLLVIFFSLFADTGYLQWDWCRVHQWNQKVTSDNVFFDGLFSDSKKCTTDSNVPFTFSEINGLVCPSYSGIKTIVNLNDRTINGKFKISYLSAIEKQPMHNSIKFVNQLQVMYILLFFWLS